MNTVQENMALVEEARQAVLNHPMCAHFSANAGYYMVYYPPGMFPEGARTPYSTGQRAAYQRLLVVMERHWKENGIHG